MTCKKIKSPFRNSYRYYFCSLLKSLQTTGKQVPNIQYMYTCTSLFSSSFNLLERLFFHYCQHICTDSLINFKFSHTSISNLILRLEVEYQFQTN